MQKTLELNLCVSWAFTQGMTCWCSHSTPFLWLLGQLWWQQILLQQPVWHILTTLDTNKLQLPWRWTVDYVHNCLRKREIESNFCFLHFLHCCIGLYGQKTISTSCVFACRTDEWHHLANIRSWKDWELLTTLQQSTGKGGPSSQSVSIVSKRWEIGIN